MNGKVLISCSTEEKAGPYVEALVQVGIPREKIRLTAADRTPAGAGMELAAGAAGLLLCGGPDIDPRYFDEEPHPNANLTILPDRDALEWQLLTGAREARTPVFGVCRGLQVTNAFLGGTLWQDLPLMWPGSILHDLSYPRDALIHSLEVVAPESEMGQILGREPSLVNSRHHQAVKEMAPSLEVVARAPDGVVEAAVANGSGWWLWGVQWHPENLTALAVQRELLARFAAQVAARNGADLQRELVTR
jgi:gamma-glutamyl-gamma-aminobutyrate hydrolase PuuD